MTNAHTPNTPTLTVSANEIRNIDNFCAAKNTGAPNYEGLCANCGWAEFSTNTRKCKTCFDKRGASARPEDNPRAYARRQGLHRYIDICSIHGKSYFGVRYGKCLGCFTTDGLARRPLPNFQVEG